MLAKAGSLTGSDRWRHSFRALTKASVRVDSLVSGWFLDSISVKVQARRFSSGSIPRTNSQVGDVGPQLLVGIGCRQCGAAHSHKCESRCDNKHQRREQQRKVEIALPRGQSHCGQRLNDLPDAERGGQASVIVRHPQARLAHGIPIEAFRALLPIDGLQLPQPVLLVPALRIAPPTPACDQGHCS